MLENLKKELENNRQADIQKFTSELEKMTVKDVLNSYYYERYCTPSVWERLQAMDKDSYNIPVDKLVKKYAHENDAYYSEKLAKIERVENMRLPVHITITIEWHRNRIWGWNPTATVCSDWQRTIGKASGCGYDKRSAAVADALNKNLEVLAIIYNQLNNNPGFKFPYSVGVFKGVPYFEGGCGIECLYKVFEVCGYSMKQLSVGSETVEVYTVTRI